MSLCKLFSLKKGDIISVVGSGGKTTLIYKLARELAKKNKVLITTSTKMKVPTDLKEKEIFIDDFENYDFKSDENNLIVMGKISENKKFGSISYERLEEISREFDYIFIESDGSKRLPYKAWRSFEPVILPMSKKTIGVIPLSYFGKKIPDEKIFNLEKFKKDFSFEEKLDIKVIESIIDSKEGIFKNSHGENYVYFSQWENHLKIEEVELLIEKLRDKQAFKNYVFDREIL